MPVNWSAPLTLIRRLPPKDEEYGISARLDSSDLRPADSPHCVTDLAMMGRLLQGLIA